MGTKEFGPFEACGNYVRTKRNADGSGGWLVAELAINESTADRAQLFAAAPELLQCLQNLLAPFGGYIEKHAPAQMESIRAALAKATGDAA